MSDPKLEEMARAWLTRKAGCPPGVTFFSGPVNISLEGLVTLLEQARREGAEARETEFLAAVPENIREVYRDADIVAARNLLAAERAAHERTREALRVIRGRALAAKTHAVRPLEARARFDAIATTAAAALRDEPEEPKA